MSIVELAEAGAGIDTILAAIDIENERVLALLRAGNHFMLATKAQSIVLSASAQNAAWGHPWTLREYAPHLREASRRLVTTFWWLLEGDELTDAQRGELYREVCRS